MAPDVTSVIEPSQEALHRGFEPPVFTVKEVAWATVIDCEVMQLFPSCTETIYVFVGKLTAEEVLTPLVNEMAGDQLNVNGAVPVALTPTDPVLAPKQVTD